MQEEEVVESDSSWMYTARVYTKNAKDKISKMSRGFRAINENVIVKSSEGIDVVIVLYFMPLRMFMLITSTYE